MRLTALIRPTLRPVVLTALLLAAAAGQVHAADLELEVSGFSGAAGEQGQLMVAVFSGAEGWLRKPVAVDRQPIAQTQDGKLIVRLTGLPDGPIALSVFQDLNGNNRLDTNPAGMPVEPFAFSRQAQGSFGPPSFEQAVLPAGTTRHAIRLPAF